MDNIVPIFIFSLPRSGSTLVQRMIAVHTEVCTISEPWFLLPVLGVEERGFGKCVYDRDVFVDAITDFIHALPMKRDTYNEAVRLYGEFLYKKIAGNKKFFLDKTPRYHLIASQIIKTFPDAKFIVLWRNPLSVVSSMVHSYNNVWRMHRFNIDLYRGLSELIKVKKRFDKKILTVNFESLVSDPEKSMNTIYKYIGLEMQNTVIDRFANVNLHGSQGDKTGIKKYKHISSEPLDKWQETLASPVRKFWCRQYIKWVGEERLHIMGYEMKELIYELDGLPSKLSDTFFNDLVRVPYSQLYSKLSKDCY